MKGHKQFRMVLKHPLLGFSHFNCAAETKEHARSRIIKMLGPGYILVSFL